MRESRSAGKSEQVQGRKTEIFPFQPRDHAQRAVQAVRAAFPVRFSFFLPLKIEIVKSPKKKSPEHFLVLDSTMFHAGGIFGKNHFIWFFSLSSVEQNTILNYSEKSIFAATTAAPPTSPSTMRRYHFCFVVCSLIFASLRFGSSASGTRRTARTACCPRSTMFVV